MSNASDDHVGDKPFPWLCPNCRQSSVVPEAIPYTAEVSHDNRAYVLEISSLTVPKCQSCGELVFDRVVDEQINAALRARLNLLTPEQVRNGVTVLGCVDE